MSQDKSWPRFPDEAEDGKLIVRGDPAKGQPRRGTNVIIVRPVVTDVEVADVKVKREVGHRFDFRKTWNNMLDFLIEHWWKFLILLIAILLALWKNSPPTIPSTTEPNPEMEKVANERFEAIVRDRRNRGCTFVYPGTSPDPPHTKDEGCRPKGQPP